LAQAYAVDDAGMIQLVIDDGVVRTDQRLEDAAVRVEAGAVQDRIVSPEKLRDAALELLVNLGGATDETHRSHPEPPTIKSLLGGGDHPWMITHAGVVIGA